VSTPAIFRNFQIAYYRAQQEVGEIENQFLEGLISNGECYNRVIDIWAQMTEEITKKIMEDISINTSRNPGGGRVGAIGLVPK